jgi:Kef-type K+ transport system membrane component KefB
VEILEHVRAGLAQLPLLATFAIALAMLAIIPRLARRARLPAPVGLLLSGVLVGPHMLGLFPAHHPIVEFFSEVGMLLLMFVAGLEIDLELFRQRLRRSIVFGIATTSIPPLLGTLVTRWLGYDLVPAIVVGSLLASHTLLASSIVAKVGVNRLEPIVVTYGATTMSDTLSLLVFAILGPVLTQRFAPRMLKASLP